MWDLIVHVFFMIIVHLFTSLAYLYHSKANSRLKSEYVLPFKYNGFEIDNSKNKLYVVSDMQNYNFTIH